MYVLNRTSGELRLLEGSETIWIDEAATIPDGIPLSSTETWVAFTPDESVFGGRRGGKRKEMLERIGELIEHHRPPGTRGG